MLYGPTNMEGPLTITYTAVWIVKLERGEAVTGEGLGLDKDLARQTNNHEKFLDLF